MLSFLDLFRFINVLIYIVGLAWCCMELEIQCTVYTPDNAPDIKLYAIESYGATVVKVQFELSLSLLLIPCIQEAASGLLCIPIFHNRYLMQNGGI